MTVELSEKAKENLRRNEESRKKESKYVKLQPGEKTTLHFDPEKMEPVLIAKRAYGINTRLLIRTIQSSQRNSLQ
ncbi:MAG: hypothetical protein DLM72_17320 [Candidatus Nitrosopolaris wilkensis]|nr:MAG: hypothetical protein DLM72_17320 [Candidatus Nitrosopolaris wilkensis]